MRYKSRVTQLAEGAENQLSNLAEKLQQPGNGGLTPKDVTDSVGTALKSVKTIIDLVDLEDEDFSRTSGAKAPGEVKAPTPPRQERPVPVQGNKDTRRVELDEGRTTSTRRVETTSDAERDVRSNSGTKRVELDD